MDIDEFLDRELADLITDADKAEKPKRQDLLMPKSSEIDFENLKYSGRGSLDNAEQSYHKLWDSLRQQKLKWNPELYDHLMVLSRQFSSLLNNSYNEAKNKSVKISELIARARAALREGRRDVPYKLYSEMQALANSIPNVFFEDKKAAQDQLLDFYKELTNTTDSELIKKVAGLMLQVNQLIGKISSSIESNDIANAAADFDKCIELYSQVPEGFLVAKNPAGIKLLDIYKSLSIYSEISNLQRQLSTQTATIAKPPALRIAVPKTMPQPVINYQKYAYPRRPEKKVYAKIEKSKSIPETIQSNQQKEIAQATPKSELLRKRVQHAKRNIKKGFYNEAWKDLEEALRIEPTDVESKVLRAKVKTLQ